MPVGLDGNPDPVRSRVRDALLAQVAMSISELGGCRMCIGVDGPAGAGKSTFADELAAALRAMGHSVVRSTTDSFHNPRSVRYRRGCASAEAYYLDSHNLYDLRRELLDPFLAGRLFRVAMFDEPSDSPVDRAAETADTDAVLVFDGLFLHRPELRPYWAKSIYLVAPGRRARYRADPLRQPNAPTPRRPSGSRPTASAIS